MHDYVYTWLCIKDYNRIFTDKWSNTLTKCLWSFTKVVSAFKLCILWNMKKDEILNVSSEIKEKLCREIITACFKTCH